MSTEAAFAYLEGLPQGFREDILYFLEDLDESSLPLVASEYRYYMEIHPETEGDEFVEHLEKVLILLGNSFSIKVRWGSYMETKIRMQWKEGSLRLPLSIKNVQQARIRERTNLLKQELVAKALAPERVEKWLEHKDNTFETMMGIY